MANSASVDFKIHYVYILSMYIKYILILWQKDTFLKEKSAFFRKIKKLAVSKRQISKYCITTEKTLTFCFHPPNGV